MAGEADIWQPRTIIEAQANTKAVQQRFSATAGQTFFTLTDFAYTVGTGALEVYKNGLRLIRGVDFVEGTDTTFSLVVPATLADTILAVGFVGISGIVDVRDTDIYLANYQAIRDYIGTETTVYAQGAVTAGDNGEDFFQKFTGAAPGTYVDDNDTIIVPTGGDGSIGWVKATKKANKVLLGLTSKTLEVGVTQQVEDLTELRGIAPTATHTIYLKRHTAGVDGGHGEFEALTGAAAGTYTDDNGVTIVPTGGDGSACWRRKLGGFVTPEMFGADTTGATTSTAAITALNNYLYTAGTRVFPGLDQPYRNLWYPSRLLISGDIKTGTALVIPPGCDVEFIGGAAIRATTSGQDVLQTTLSTQNPSAFGVYSSDKTRIFGTGLVDGAGVASRGILLDTIAEGSSIDINVIGCTHSRFSTTGTGIAGTKTLTVASSANAKVGDTIDIVGEYDGNIPIYNSITAISGTTWTLANNLLTSPAGALVTHNAVGITGMMCQQSDIRVNSWENTIGEVWTSNADGFACTDLNFVGGGVEGNINCGVALIDTISARSIERRWQHTYGGIELFIGPNCIDTKIIGYVESASDARLVAKAVKSVAQMQMVPLIFNYGQRTRMDLHWPINPTTTSWRRLLFNRGENSELSVSTLTVALLENPSRAGDYGIVEQLSSVGHILVSRASGQLTFITDMTGVIVDESGTKMPTNRSAVRNYRSGGEYKAGSPVVEYRLTATDTAYSLFRSGESHPRLSVAGNAFGIGDGAAQISRYIQWGAGSPEGVITASPGSLYIRNNGGAGTTLYVKESGTGNTGWVGK